MHAPPTRHSRGRRVVTTVGLGCSTILQMAPDAQARPEPRLDFQFSHSPQETSVWTDDLPDAISGVTFYVRVVMRIPETFYGIAGAKFNITSSGRPWQPWRTGIDSASLTPAKGDPTDARMTGFDHGIGAQEVFEEGNRLRIDALGDVNDAPVFGINADQDTPVRLGTHFNTHNSVTVYKFALTLFTADPRRELALRIMDGGSYGYPDELRSFRAYEFATSTFSTEVFGAYGDEGLIVLPTPATGGALLIAPMSVRRRRRMVATVGA